MLIAVSVGILMKATRVLENAIDAIREIGDAASDLRVATVSLRADVVRLVGREKKSQNSDLSD